jgi:metallo-beta-lactamase class B
VSFRSTSHESTAAGPRAALALAALLALAGACASQAGVPYEMRRWNRDFPAHRVMANIYYVGSEGVAQFLIATPAGLILLDSGFEAAVPRLRANVEKLGFRFQDVKILLSSHAHIDHVQGHALVRRLTGAQVVTSAADAVFIAAGGKGEPVFDGIYAWTPCPVDRVVGDGDTVTLGGTTLTAHLTPGHTIGAITWTMQVPPPGATSRPLDVVFFPSANVNPGVRLLGNARYPAIVADFRRSFAIWNALPCDLFLGVHGDFYGLQDKYARLGPAAAGGTTNPFIDPQGYRRFVAEAEGRFRQQLDAERSAKQN